MEFIVDWNAVCLVCLQEGNMRSLNEKDSIGILLSEKIRKCSNIAISGRNFPEQICMVCEKDLEAAYRFKTNAESSNAILKSLLGTQIEMKSKSVAEDVGSKKKFISPNEIKTEEIINEVRIQPEVTNLKLIADDSPSERFQPVVVNNYDQFILPRNFLTMAVKKTEKKTGRDFVDKKMIGDFGKAHTKTKHNNKPLKICEICGNSYKYQNALDSHMRRHRNEKPFSCEFCQRCFVANVELRRHMRVHTGQKPYTCHFCPRAFSDFGSRGKHERTHTGERPYACETCGKTFAYAHVLQVHILTHTGEKKYKCCTCGKGFTKKSYLISHTNNNHRSKN